MIKCKVAIAKQYECTKCCMLCEQKGSCTDMCDCAFDESCDLQVFDDFGLIEAQANNAVSMLENITIQIENLKKQEEQFRQMILQAMENSGVKKVETPKLTITYVDATTRSSVDSTKLKNCILLLLKSV